MLFDGKLLDFELDSGEQSGSQLWTRFADDFATLLKERGTKSKKQVTEVGGSNERDIIELPEMHFRVGGFDATLHPARVYAKPVGDEFHYGHLGMDVLSQAREVRLDFASMTLDLLPQARGVKARAAKEACSLQCHFGGCARVTSYTEVICRIPAS